jgi:hypothetical protein
MSIKQFNSLSLSLFVRLVLLKALSCLPLLFPHFERPNLEFFELKWHSHTLFAQLKLSQLFTPKKDDFFYPSDNDGWIRTAI